MKRAVSVCPIDEMGKDRCWLGRRIEPEKSIYRNEPV
jgi:hypothetical protein